MKIVLDITKKRFKDIQRIAEVQLERNHFQTAEQIIANGTPLPKGHGRLIDADEISYNHTIARNIEDGHNWNELVATKDEITDLQTIIETDKEGAEE